MSVQTAIARELPAGTVSIPRANRLLASLPEEDYRRVSPYLRPVSLRSRQSLLRQGQPVQDIIFPVAGVCSLVKTTEDGHSIEILGIGSEGAIGATVVLGQRESAADVTVLVSDEAALSLPLEVFKGELQRGDGAVHADDALLPCVHAAAHAGGRLQCAALCGRALLPLAAGDRRIVFRAGAFRLRRKCSRWRWASGARR